MTFQTKRGTTCVPLGLGAEYLDDNAAKRFFPGLGVIGTRDPASSFCLMSSLEAIAGYKTVKTL